MYSFERKREHACGEGQRERETQAPAEQGGHQGV